MDIRKTFGLLALLTVSGAAQAQTGTPDFNREVRPILASSCLKCHGPDDKQRQAGLRLDVSPGPVKLNAVLNRIARPDGDPLQMPPMQANKPLSASQKSVLNRWVASGARYETHWAFVAPKPAPTAKSIDDFVTAKLKARGLSLQPEADRYALIRRVSLDLIGLPPTIEETDAFLRDKSPDAYERLVDRLLASPRYGEKWARPWLDLARYADTNGYEKDKPRSIWPWRDWVIKSLNADMPFDLFTVKQLAGDLLPNATQGDRIATGFHRNTMLNEEGGIDPLEFRYYAMVDRVATTGTTWLGLTIQCAQCHTHKYDPITQKEYYQLMAFLDNTEEPELDVVTPELARKRVEVEKTILAKEKTLAESWPLPETLSWAVAKSPMVQTASSATVTLNADGAALVSGASPDKDTYTVTLPGSSEPVSILKLEALTDPTLGASGPGRTAHGNFVLTEIEVLADGKPVKLMNAEHDFAQDGFSAQAALDGKPNTGWAIQGPGAWNVNRTARFTLATPTSAKVWTVTLRQDYGGGHTIGKFRLSLGSPVPDANAKPESERRAEAFSRAFDAWKAARKTEVARWTPVVPTKATSNLPLLSVRPDGTVFASGDFTKRDVYDLKLQGLPQGVTALRLEALPDDQLPNHGPGRVAYEGPHGDFHLSTLTTSSGKLIRGVSNVGNAQNALDTNPQTGWSVNGAQGKTSVAVFAFEKPLETTELSLKMVFEQYYAAGLGKFRLSVTTDPNAGKTALLPDLESASITGDDTALKLAFVRAAPELASARAALSGLRRSLPEDPTTLVFSERPRENPRPTFVHNRGEFLQPTEKVVPGVPSVLPIALGSDRLAFARWLVSSQNPLTPRVVANRAWAAFFGRGIVKTTEDFGYQGSPPTHLELLDSLATEFVKSGWSQKKLHKRIVMSRSYRQSSKVSSDVRAKDPENMLLSRGPRVRLDAEGVRDNALAASGLLSGKIGGPSVFPPQPASVTTEGAYGALSWTVSVGEDRYRRGLYTFAKRTAPYALSQTFDAPSGEATCPRRESSNTPLQALALLNDPVFQEAAQALGKQTNSQPGSVGEHVTRLFRRVVVRPPDKGELEALTAFYEKQRARFASGELSPDALCGKKATPERAAWTALARAIMNLDEAIVKR